MIFASSWSTVTSSVNIARLAMSAVPWLCLLLPPGGGPLSRLSSAINTSRSRSENSARAVIQNPGQATLPKPNKNTFSKGKEKLTTSHKFAE